MPKKASTTAKNTAVEWAWRDDQGNWKPYDDAFSTKLETAFQLKEAEVKVDKERFIDLGVTSKEIKDSFNFTVDKSIIALQRRYDDHTKRRAVRRVVPEIFSKDNIYILSKQPKKTIDALKKDIELYQGIATEKWTKKVNLVLCEKDDVDSFTAELKQASDANVSIVSVDWLDECINQKTRVDTKGYIVDFKEKEEEKEEEEEEEAPEPPAKKAKLSSSSSVSTPASTTTTTAAALPKTVSISEEIWKDCPELRGGSQWQGVCTQKSDSSTFPHILKVDTRTATAFTGTMMWPTLNGAKTKVKGTVNGLDINFEEYEIITGKEEVEVPVKYAAKYATDGSISGDVQVADDDEIASTFELKRIKSAPAKDFDPFKSGAKFQGTAFVPYAFSIEVQSRSGSNVSGQVVWPSLNGAITKFRGTIEGSSISIEEYESKSADVVIPTNYVGRVSGSNVEGSFQTEETKGKFEIKMS